MHYHRYAMEGFGQPRSDQRVNQWDVNALAPARGLGGGAGAHRIIRDVSKCWSNADPIKPVAARNHNLPSLPTIIILILPLTRFTEHEPGSVSAAEDNRNIVTGRRDIYNVQASAHHPSAGSRILHFPEW